MSSIAIRYFLIKDESEIIRLSNARFERLSSNPPKDNLEEFSDQRVRWVEIVVELENRKPSKILRITYGYLYFNSDGYLSFEHFMHDAVVVANAGAPNFIIEEGPHNVINAQREFAKKQRDHSVWWEPNTTLERQIMNAAMDQHKYHRL